MINTILINKPYEIVKKCYRTLNHRAAQWLLPKIRNDFYQEEPIFMRIR